jgi:hypothetical protein
LKQQRIFKESKLHAKEFELGQPPKLKQQRIFKESKLHAKEFDEPSKFKKINGNSNARRTRPIEKVTKNIVNNPMVKARSTRNMEMGRSKVTKHIDAVLQAQVAIYGNLIDASLFTRWD